MSVLFQVWPAFVAAFLLALVLTPLARAAARRAGMVAQPKADRWHRAPTALLGGTAVYFATMPVAAPLAIQASHYGVLLGATAMFLVGILDDFVHLKPATKLIAQIAAASLLLLLSEPAVFTGSRTADALLSILWIVGLTNAFNLLDNMDGLCAGIGMIAALAFAVTLLPTAAIGTAVLPVALAGALLGFLVYNFNPASIFLGDGGSLFIGFVLAGLTVTAQDPGQSKNLLTLLAVPVLILSIPILDTSLVTVARKLSGRSASQGGTDHMSHRLVALGFSERRAVLLLWSLATVAGTAAALVTTFGVEDASLLAALVVLGLVLLAVALARVRVYKEGDYSALENRIYTPLLIDLTYRRRVFEVLLDFVIIGLSYYAAFRLRYEGAEFADHFPEFIDSLPIVIGATVIGFWIGGVYRGFWRYVSLADMGSYVRGVLLGQALALAGVFGVYGTGELSRSVFIINMLLLLVLLVGSRLSFRALGEFAARHRKRSGRRVLIYGAGDAGTVLLREILNNNRYNYVPLGFLDDDPRLKGRKIHGYDVLGGLGDLEHLIFHGRIDAVLVSTGHLTADREAELRRLCNESGIPLINLHFELQPFEISRLEEHPAAK